MQSSYELINAGSHMNAKSILSAHMYLLEGLLSSQLEQLLEVDVTCQMMR